MSFWRWAAGEAAVRLTSADPESALQELTALGIELQDVAQEDGLTVVFRIPAVKLGKVEKSAKRRGWTLTILEQSGLGRTLRNWMARPVMVIGLAVILAATIYLPSRVLFVRVEGNTVVPTRMILEKAAGCGIGFGAARQAVRSQKMKDALLDVMPELQWAGVTTAGCTATITVRERGPEEKQSQNQVSSIIAAQDGILTAITVTRGTARFTVGQAVRAGDVLISGYTDCGFCIRAQRAEGEVFARTEREMWVQTPSDWQTQGEIQAVEKKYSLIIGKKRINFYKGSGISGGTCDKMYVEYYVTLPGGFQLPVCFVTEVWSYAPTTETILPEAEATALLKDFSARYLGQLATAGTVTQRREEVTAGEGIYCLTGNYACIEMIGQQRNEDQLIGKYD